MRNTLLRQSYCSLIKLRSILRFLSLLPLLFLLGVCACPPSSAADSPQVAQNPEKDLEKLRIVQRTTTFAEGKQYFIFRKKTGPAKSLKMGGLSPEARASLLIPVEFEANPKQHPEPFEVRMAMVVTDSKTKRPIELVNTGSFNAPDAPAALRSGQTVAAYLPTENTLQGEGVATIYLIRKSDKSDPKAISLSNKITVPFVMGK